MAPEKGTMTIKNEKRRSVCTAHRCEVGGYSAPYHAVRCGFTLAEAMMAVVLLGVAAAGLLLPFSSGARLRSEGTRRTLGAKLASHLMEQIVDTPFDQIMDYDGYTEPEGQVKDAAGGTFADVNYAKFSRDVSCTYAYVPQEKGTAEPVFIRVTVRAYWDGKDVATVHRLVSK